MKLNRKRFSTHSDSRSKDDIKAARQRRRRHTIAYVEEPITQPTKIAL